jgi:hypothetical protein
VFFHVHNIYIDSIKFDIDLNNDELLKSIWEHKKKKKLIITNNAQYCKNLKYDIQKDVHVVNWEVF